MNRQVVLLAAILGVPLLLSACASSARMDPYRPGSMPGAMAEPAPMPEPVEPVPSGPVYAEPLPPLAGEPLPPPSGDYGAPSAGAAPGDIAALPSPPPAAAAPSRPSRSALVGGWSAREASGGSCRVQLSSAPALDLYKASTSGCSNRDLARISAWEYRDGEVYLYQPGGAVAARLRGGSGSLEGVLAKSGAPLRMTR
jgi:protease inhibitor Inh